MAMEDFHSGYVTGRAMHMYVYYIAAVLGTRSWLGMRPHISH